MKEKFVGDNLFSKVNEYGYPEYQLLMDSQEVEAVLEHLGVKEKYSFLLVKLEEGDYKEVWGGTGAIPYVWEKVKRIR